MHQDKIVLYGAGKVMNQVKNILENEEIVPKAIFDKNPKLWGTYVMFGGSQIEIRSLAEITLYDKSDTTIVITVGRNAYHEVHLELSRHIKYAKLVYCRSMIYEIAKERYQYRKTNWIIDYESAVEQWLSLLNCELNHHERTISLYKDNDSSDWKREKTIPRLQNYQLKENAVLLDIGAGSVLKYDSVINGKKIKYIPVDVLKDGYDYLREVYNFKVPYVTQFAFGEHLRCFFEGGGVDFVIFDNSLDHTINPVRCLIEAFCITAIDGVLSLRHAGVESMMGNAEGLHQWDFLVTDKGEFVIADRTNFMNISELFSPYAEIETKEQYSDDYCTTVITVNIKKRKELDTDILEKYDSRKDEGILLHVLFKTILRLTQHFDNGKQL